MLRSLIRRLLGRPDPSQLALDLAPPARRRGRQNPRTHRDDAHLARSIEAMHATYNAKYFDGSLSTITIRVSRRMRSRLGFYACASPAGAPPEIAINRTHLRRDGWEEALHTLLHEMVHQWQDETGHPVDHGTHFRTRARAIGITPRACRDLAGPEERSAAAARRSNPVRRNQRRR